MKRICLAALAAFVIFAFVSAMQAQTPQETLNQYISDLQKNPNDYALREKIIKHVQTMRSAPAVPEEARRYFIEGNALLKAAKDQKGYGLAIDAYRQCLLIAPWWAEAYYNYSVALELANRFDEAVNVLKLYIATTPGEAESRKAQDKIYEIGAKKKLAAQEREESSPQAVAAREQNKFEDWLKKLDGRRYTVQVNPHFTEVLDVRGSIFVTGNINCWEDQPCQYREMQTNTLTSRFEIRGRETTLPDLPAPDLRTQRQIKFWVVGNTYIISEDGNRITRRIRYNDGDVREYIYLWQR